MPALALTDSTPLIGRRRELTSVVARLHAAQAQAGGTVLIAGEAGIGKSRLVAEVKAHAAQQHVLVVQGYCFEPARSLPYAPLLDVLRALVAGRPTEELPRLLGASAPELLTLLPELAPRLPDVVPTPALEPDQDKRRLFHALAAFLTGFSAPRPALVIIEDLHWSDDTSLEFLFFLARRLTAYPLLLVLTYRTDEAHPVLSHTLAELDRERLAIEVPLSRLTVAEVEAMIRAIVGQQRPVRADFLDAIVTLTDGNPFFIEEVLRSLIAAGDGFSADGRWEPTAVRALRIPRTVQDAVRRRVARLSEAARQVLVLAAVAGQRFDFALLQDLAARDERDLLSLVKELIAAHLVVEASADQFTFRHALTRQAVSAGLLARERRAVHRRIVEVLRRRPAHARESLLADLAYHAYEAGAWAEALAYARRVGERAQALHAPRAAVDHFTRALAAARQLSLPAPPELYRARGLAYETLGDFEGARTDHDAALATAQQAGDHQAEWQALLDLGFLWASRDYARAGACFRRALELARGVGEPALIARSLNRLGNWHANSGEPHVALRHHREALDTFEQMADRPGIAETLDLLALASSLDGDVLQAATHYERAIPLFRALDNRPMLVFSLALRRGCDVPQYGAETLVGAAARPAGPPPEDDTAIVLAQELGFRAGEAFALLMSAVGLGPRGMYARALGRAQQGLAIAEEIAHHQWIVLARYTLGALHLDVLDLPAARGHLERALMLAAELGSLHWRRLTSAYLGIAYARDGDPARADAVLDAALGADDPAQGMAARMVWYARAEVALARGDAPRALQITDRLIASAKQRAPDTVIPNLWKQRADALAALGRGDEAERTLHAAAAGAAAGGARPLLWRIHLALGRLYRTRGPHDAAAPAETAARALAAELAAELADESLRRTFLRGARALCPGREPAAGLRPAAPAYPDGLTPREVEVLRLIAAGRSNREIAAALVLSERTVERHIANIYGKIGARGKAARAAAAAYTLIHHLADFATATPA